MVIPAERTKCRPSRRVCPFFLCRLEGLGSWPFLKSARKLRNGGLHVSLSLSLSLHKKAKSKGCRGTVTRISHGDLVECDLNLIDVGLECALSADIRIKVCPLSLALTEMIRFVVGSDVRLQCECVCGRILNRSLFLFLHSTPSPLSSPQFPLSSFLCLFASEHHSY